jgi:hypothetical protein
MYTTKWWLPIWRDFQEVNRCVTGYGITNGIRTSINCHCLPYTLLYNVTVRNVLKRSIYVFLHNDELHNLYSSPSIIRMIKSRRLRWAGHVARMGKKRNAYRILVGKPEGKRQYENGS